MSPWSLNYYFTIFILLRTHLYCSSIISNFTLSRLFSVGLFLYSCNSSLTWLIYCHLSSISALSSPILIFSSYPKTFSRAPSLANIDSFSETTLKFFWLESQLNSLYLDFKLRRADCRWLKSQISSSSYWLKTSRKRYSTIF